MVNAKIVSALWNDAIEFLLRGSVLTTSQNQKGLEIF